MNEKPRIIFYGTPEFAVASLDLLVKCGHNIVGVVTAPDKPSGRGRLPGLSAVKKYAVQSGLNLLQPEKLKNEEFVDEIRRLSPDIQVVVAFRMLPREVWGIPTHGTFNLHASLLPLYRGAAPINWAIINGETETGVTTFLIDEKIDTGKILYFEKTSISTEEDAGVVHDRLMSIGAQLVLKTTDALWARSVKMTDQTNLFPVSGDLPKAPKIQKEDTRISWFATTEEVYNFIRGLSPHPGAFTEILDKDGNPHFLKVFKTRKEDSAHSFSPGHILTDGKSYFKVAVKNGFIHFLVVQLQGRKVMNVVEFLNGFARSFS